MIDRRTFLSSSALLLLGAALPQSSIAAPAGGRLVWGVASGNQGSSIGTRLAVGVLDLLTTQFNLRYQLDILAARDTQQASETVKLAPPDGATLLQVQSGSMVLFPAMYKSLQYDPQKDFTPVASLGDFGYAFSVGPVVPASVTNINQYLAWVKDNPDLRDIGFSVYGSHNHLIALMLAREKEAALRAQSYNYPESILADMKNNQLAAAVTTAGNAPLLKAIGARVLAVSSSSRLAALPDVPTFKEQGLDKIVIDGWYGWFAPARTPPATLQALIGTINAMVALPQFAELQKKNFLTPNPMTPAQITDRMKKEIVSNQNLVSSYNLSKIG
ncbi:MAG: tripartite tricarboxylate transporter substrate-binding protein [Janthinobacterium lividum]|uniref:tripartite tricarboxylate transporter substrate-binding protein n=1 Tax=Pseudomonas sp. MWU16-30317 TaxID=2878095 RepID=UPI001CFB5DBF